METTSLAVIFPKGVRDSLGYVVPSRVIDPLVLRRQSDCSFPKPVPKVVCPVLQVFRGWGQTKLLG